MLQLLSRHNSEVNRDECNPFPTGSVGVNRVTHARLMHHVLQSLVGSEAMYILLVLSCPVSLLDADVLDRL